MVALSCRSCWKPTYRSHPRPGGRLVRAVRAARHVPALALGAPVRPALLTRRLDPYRCGVVASGDCPVDGAGGLAFVAEPDFSAHPASLQVGVASAH